MISNGEYTNNVDYLAQESPLKLCGYSVAQSAGFSAATRQKLLEDMIRANAIRKHEVIQYLSWFIQMNGQKYGNELAKRKWEDDLRFVRNLDISKQDTYTIEKIKPYSEYRKSR